MKDYFYYQQKEEWPIDRLCNVIEIKNNEMIQLFLVERSWNQWFLSKETLCIRRLRKKKMFSEIWPQSQGSQSKLTGRKLGSVKEHGDLRMLKRWLESLTKFTHNIFSSNLRRKLKLPTYVGIFHGKLICTASYSYSSKAFDCLIYVSFFTYLLRRDLIDQFCEFQHFLVNFSVNVICFILIT